MKKDDIFGENGPEGRDSDGITSDDKGGAPKPGMKDFSAKPQKKKPGINPAMLMALLAASRGGGMGGPPGMGGGPPMPMGGPPGLGGPM